MTIKGTVKRIFSEKENGFKILSLNVDDVRCVPLDKRNPDYPNCITVVGVMKGVEQDYVVEVTGEWEHRPSGNYWPWHWKATDYSVCEFETPRLIRKFLSELPSVGTELAARIIRLYPNANVVVEKYPEKLTVIMGIDKSKAFQIQKEFLQLKERRSLGSFLQKYGLKSEDISKISSHYGNNALALLRKNPYLLCMDGFASFKLCDKIGKDLGIAADVYCRLSCAMKVVLKSMAAAKGYTYLTEELLIEDSNEFFRENAVMECTFSKELLAERLRNLIAQGEIVYEEGRFYHPDRYQNEKDIADILLRRAGRPSRYENVDESIIDGCLDLVQCEIGILLDSLQLEAVKSAIKNSTMVITGGPGSGKTTLLNTFIKTVEYMAQKIGMPKPSFSLAAPTGMASKRMAASTGKEARTIHKLFEIHYESLMNSTEIKQLETDIVILDEVSMLDIDVMAHIMRSLKDDTMLILVGDRDQIPSIGPGNVLSDIIESESIPVVRLVHSYRHGARKTILTNANKINNGDEDLVTNRSDFVLYTVPDKGSDKDCKRLRAVTERVFCEEFLSGGKDLFKIQVLSPLRSKTQASVDELNIVLQKIANPKISENEEIKFGRAIFRKGDKVMQSCNDYDKGVFNGDIGIIKLVSAEKKILQVDFQGNLVEYSGHEIEQLKHAFATTVHKAQGQEFPIVIMVMTGFHSMMLLRNLFYTGVTRAKQRLIVIGDEEAVKYAIRNTKGNKRLSALCGRLRKGT